MSTIAMEPAQQRADPVLGLMLDQIDELREILDRAMDHDDPELQSLTLAALLTACTAVDHYVRRSDNEAAENIAHAAAK